MNKWWVILSVVCLSVSASFLLSHDALAAREPRNASEVNAWNNYLRLNRTCGQGALWFNDKHVPGLDPTGYGPSDGWEKGYYSTSVAPVDADQETLTVFLHGSAVMGGECSASALPFFATHISSMTPQLTIHGRNLYRGSGDASGWTSIGGSLPATLDIRGLATPGDPNGYDMPVKFWRCGDFYLDGSAGRCSADTLHVKIIRKASPWRIEGNSYIRRETDANRNQDRDWSSSGIRVKPGDTINFKHTATVRDADVMQWLKYTVRGQNLPRGPHAGSDPNVIWSEWVKPNITQNTTFIHHGPYSGAKNPSNITRYTVQSGDAGKLLCQRIEWVPGDYKGAAQAETPFVCAGVPFEYTLKPSIDMASSTILLGQKKVAGVRGAVFNSGPTHSQPTRSGVVRFIAKGDNSVNEAGDNVKMNIENPCEVAGHIAGRNGLSVVGGSCKDIYKDGSDREFGLDQTTIHSADDDIDGAALQAGDQVCYATVVAAYQRDIGRDTSSYAVKCIVVSKKPKVQFWGGDVRAGVSGLGGTGEGMIQTSTTILDEQRYGSWAEYSMLASGSIISSSGAGLSGGGPLGAPAREYNQLTFRNTKAPFGRFGRLTGYQYPAIAAGSGSLKIDGAQLAASGEYKAASVEIAGGTVARSATVHIQAKTVRITGNITYLGDPLGSVAEVPQLVIQADHIIIEPHVQRVDGWLLANKTVSTCAEAKNGKGWPEAELLASGACDKEQLRINGPIATKSLYLRRTHGSEQGEFARPAEILNLRPDAYLARYGRSRTSGAIQTMYSRELPPRF